MKANLLGALLVCLGTSLSALIASATELPGYDDLPTTIGKTVAVVEVWIKEARTSSKVNGPNTLEVLAEVKETVAGEKIEGEIKGRYDEFHAPPPDRPNFHIDYANYTGSGRELRTRANDRVLLLLSGKVKDGGTWVIVRVEPVEKKKEVQELFARKPKREDTGAPPAAPATKPAAVKRPIEEELIQSAQRHAESNPDCRETVRQAILYARGLPDRKENFIKVVVQRRIVQFIVNQIPADGPVTTVTVVLREDGSLEKMDKQVKWPGLPELSPVATPQERTPGNQAATCPVVPQTTTAERAWEMLRHIQTNAKAGQPLAEKYSAALTKTLHGLLEGEDQHGRHEALIILRDHWGSPGWAPTVIATLDKMLQRPAVGWDQAASRIVGCEILRKYPNKRAIPVLVKALEDPFEHHTMAAGPHGHAEHLYRTIWWEADAALRKITQASPIDAPLSHVAPKAGEREKTLAAWKRWFEGRPSSPTGPMKGEAVAPGGAEKRAAFARRYEIADTLDVTDVKEHDARAYDGHLEIDLDCRLKKPGTYMFTFAFSPRKGAAATQKVRLEVTKPRAHGRDRIIAQQAGLSVASTREPDVVRVHWIADFSPEGPGGSWTLETIGFTPATKQPEGKGAPPAVPNPAQKISQSQAIAIACQAMGVAEPKEFLNVMPPTKNDPAWRIEYAHPLGPNWHVTVDAETGAVKDKGRKPSR